MRGTRSTADLAIARTENASEDGDSGEKRTNEGTKRTKDERRGLENLEIRGARRRRNADVRVDERDDGAQAASQSTCLCPTVMLVHPPARRAGAPPKIRPRRRSEPSPKRPGGIWRVMRGATPAKRRRPGGRA